MGLYVACPHCGVVTQIDAAYLGETGDCRACGREMTVAYPIEFGDAENLARLDGLDSQDEEIEYFTGAEDSEDPIRLTREESRAKERPVDDGYSVVRWGTLAFGLLVVVHSYVGMSQFSPRANSNRKWQSELLRKRVEKILEEGGRYPSRPESPYGRVRRLSEEEQRAFERAASKYGVKPRGVIVLTPPDELPSLQPGDPP